MVLLDILNSPLIEYESYIPSFSKIAGKNFETIEKKFDVVIDHYHKRGESIDIQRAPHPHIIVKSGMSLKILGLQKNINRLCEEYNLP